MYKPFVKSIHKTKRFANIKQDILQRGKKNDSKFLKDPVLHAWHDSPWKHGRLQTECCVTSPSTWSSSVSGFQGYWCSVSWSGSCDGLTTAPPVTETHAALAFHTHFSFRLSVLSTWQIRIPFLLPYGVPTSTFWRLSTRLVPAGLFYCFHNPPNSEQTTGSLICAYDLFACVYTWRTSVYTSQALL